MSWTNWRLLADRSTWYSDSFDHDGAACYELTIGGPRGGNLQDAQYVGHTGNERQRMSNYGRDGSHLAKIVADHLKRDWFLYYRAWTCSSKKAAEQMERRLLSQCDYPWNKLLNQ